MTTLRRALLAFLGFLSGSTTLVAGPTYTANFAPPLGPSFQYGSNADYFGPNDVGGAINSSGGGILGNDTPLHSGQYFGGSNLIFSVSGQSGQILLAEGFSGTIIESNINATGGTAEFGGQFSSAAAAFFGVSSTTDEIGTMTLKLEPAITGGPYAYLASAQVVITPGFATPEPSSLVLLSLGCLGGVAVIGRTWWRTR